MKLASSQNINCRDTQGRNSTPLHLAGKYVLDRLWSHLGLITGICFNNYIFNKHHPLHKKWSFKYFFSKCDQIRSFLRFGHIYWRNPVTLFSMTHSLYLAGYNHVEVAEFLLESGADVNAQDKGGLTPLHNASSYGVCSDVSSETWHTFKMERFANYRLLAVNYFCELSMLDVWQCSEYVTWCQGIQ